ncbi:MAG: 30S ribosomal protein S13 [candidate division WS2 bacterium]|uniref:Small ribosomal subunit protein uS13 n=1 Tax=Psychracetigena formicireducens TaxID=2986056 RepID=A0A9E2BFJ8_PSYF1|nr:30S ribosomal protein S13 [Candidatus Psychracetigena formicireducens]MBT9144680.1 30S ribosomal protein S13 [Candidatus Psychracetigena formicireducens]MBT9150198.1 30S ribosomal protein S13 [Candidatus Psychracetigena formicireducens]
MARIVGIDLPKDKKLEYALRYIYGIGPVNVNQVLADTGIDGTIRVRELTSDQIHTLNEVIGKGYKVEGDLRKEAHLNIRRLVSIGCYRGLRHKRGMPVRGQRTRTNARTRKGPRKASGIKKR